MNFEEFEEFEREMEKAAEKADKATKAAEEEKIAELENLRDHYIPEVTQTVYYLFEAISPFLDSFRYCCGSDGLVIASYDAEASVVVDGMQITVHFDDYTDITVELSSGGYSDIDMLSQQVKLLQAADAFLNNNINDIMAFALKRCGRVHNNDIADTDTEVQSVYHVAIDIDE